MLPGFAKGCNVAITLLSEPKITKHGRGKKNAMAHETKQQGQGNMHTPVTFPYSSDNFSCQLLILPQSFTAKCPILEMVQLI